MTGTGIEIFCSRINVIYNKIGWEGNSLLQKESSPSNHFADRYHGPSVLEAVFLDMCSLL